MRAKRVALEEFDVDYFPALGSGVSSCHWPLRLVLSDMVLINCVRSCQPRVGSGMYIGGWGEAALVMLGKSSNGPTA